MKSSLRVKFIVPLIIAALVLGLVLGFFISSSAEKKIIEHAKTITSEVVRLQVEKNLKEEDFYDPVNGFYMRNLPAQISALKLNQEFLKKFLTKIGTEEILRIKIWDIHSMVIYSDLPRLIGLSFPENVHIKNALLGKVDVEISRLDEQENIYEKGSKEFKEILEVYTPIISRQNGEVVGVVETYHSTAKMANDIKREQFLIWLVVFVPLIGLLIFILILLERSIIKPIRALKEMTKIVGKGEFRKLLEVKRRDEVGELEKNFNLMIKNLETVTAELGRAKELDRLKSEYVTILAHRFLTPLSEIKWITSSMLKDGLDTEEQKSFRDILGSSERLIQLTSNLLRYAEIEEGLFNYKFQPVSLEFILEKSVKNYIQKAKEKNIQIVFERREEKLPLINGDEQKLETTFENLLDNAIKYTSPGGKIVIKISKKDGELELVFDDTGMGISLEDAPRIFAKFFRGEEAKKAHTEGSGLGLFIVKNIIEKHNGTITLKNKKERGVTFVIKLPFIE